HRSRWTEQLHYLLEESGDRRRERSLRGHVDRILHDERPALCLGQRGVYYVVLAARPGCGARPELDSAAANRTSEGPRPAVERAPGGRAGGGTAGPRGPGGP